MSRFDRPDVSDEYDVVVAGGGVAGLTAGLFAARAGCNTLILTGGVPGGPLLSIERIEGLPGFPEGIAGYDFCPMLQEQAEAAGAECSGAEWQSVAFDDGAVGLQTTEGERRARTLIIATGSRLKALGVPGEERLRGKGVSHCASCDAPLLRGQVVGVVGGGDSAMQEALTLAESVAEVILLHREAALTGQASYRQRVAAHPRITVRGNTRVEEILGDSAVTGVRVRDLAGSRETSIALAAVFVYVGLQPNTRPLAGQIGLDAHGRVLTDTALRTERPGVLAAGNVRAGSAGQAVHACGDGALAALTADRYLRDARWR